MARNNTADSDSISSQDPNVKDDKKNKKNKSRRPPNTAFRQQRLKAWQPILTPKTVLPLFFAVGIIFAPIGGLLLWVNSQVQEISIDYSECSQKAPENDFGEIPGDKITKTFKSTENRGQPPKWQREIKSVKYADAHDIEVPDTVVCTIEFDIESDLKPPVLFYYRLTDFYQNHRRYVKSFDAAQLKGDARTVSQIQSSDCDPLKVDPDTNKPYYPCGLIANSLFNDTFHPPVLQNPSGTSQNSTRYEMSKNGIAWGSDKDLYGPTKYKPDEISPPKNWRRKWPAYNESFPPPNLEEDESFQVWMRTAGLPMFSKLAMRNDDKTMTSGRYRVEIWDEFDVTLYGGTKEILISTRTAMGGKNPFLGIAYVVVGGICVLLGLLFTATHLIKPRKLGDHTYLTWDKEQSTTATATGRSIRPGDSA